MPRPWEPAEEAGLVRIGRDLRRVAHPLFASAVYASASTSRRRRTHLALTSLVHDPEERARHLALSCDGPDSAGVEELEAAAAGASAWRSEHGGRIRRARAPPRSGRQPARRRATSAPCRAPLSRKRLPESRRRARTAPRDARLGRSPRSGSADARGDRLLAQRRVRGGRASPSRRSPTPETRSLRPAVRCRSRCTPGRSTWPRPPPPPARRLSCSSRARTPTQASSPPPSPRACAPSSSSARATTPVPRSGRLPLSRLRRRRRSTRGWCSSWASGCATSMTSGERVSGWRRPRSRLVRRATTRRSRTSC